jgi:hypothetical protein
MPCAWRLQASLAKSVSLETGRVSHAARTLCQRRDGRFRNQKLSDSTQEGNNLVSIGVISVRCICKILFWAAVGVDGVDGVDGDVVVKERGFDAGGDTVTTASDQETLQHHVLDERQAFHP